MATDVNISNLIINKLTQAQYASLVSQGLINSNEFYVITDDDVDLSTKEDKSNKTTSINENSTDTQYPSASAVYNYLLSLKGVNSGIAELDANGKVPSSQLPSYVDDVLEYDKKSNFPETGETGKIYVAKDTNVTYRWSGSAYTEISASLALGETSSTAYRGDRGKTAYDHSQITSGNPHNVTKTDVGLGNVDNTADADKIVKKAGTADSATQSQDAITEITRSGTTFTAKRRDGTTFTFTQQDNDTKALGSMTGTLGVDHGGTGATTAAAARTNLGIGAIGTKDSLDYSDVGLAKAITNITRNGTTFTVTYADGTTGTFTQQDNNTWTKVSTTADGYITKLPNDASKFLDGKGNWTVPNYPTELKNPNSLTVQYDGNDVFEYNGSLAQTLKLASGAQIGIDISDDAIRIRNKGTRYVQTGDTNGTLKVDNNGTVSDIPVKGLAGAAYKNVDTSISAASTSTNLPTSAAVAAFVEGKGYKTTDNNTTYTLTQDSTNGHKITLTPSSGTATTITIPDNNTTYTGSNGISLSGTNFTNSGVRSIATGSTNGTISVNTNGTTADVAVKGLGALAYKASLSASDVGAIASSLKGANNGVAELDANGKVPSSQLPSYVDDVLEYDKQSSFPATGETGKIYITKDTNKTYRWSGSSYTEISASLALGTTSSTAYRGDYGNIAYTHATDANKLTTATASGLYKIAATANGHIQSLTAVTKADITALGIPGSDTNTWTAFKGATADAAGTAGYVPAPAKGDQAKFFRADGTWVVPTNTDTHYTTTIYAGSGSKANAVTTNGNTKIALYDNDTSRSTLTIKGTGATTVTSDANGVITINSTNTTYSSLKNPNALALQANGTTKVSYDGSTANQTFNIATGSTNGTIAVAGTDVSVKGLAALAYKASLGKSDVGLGNVDNTSDANKPVSTATQTALNAKVNKAGDTITGELKMSDTNKITFGDAISLMYNSTDECLDFVFA